MPCCKDKNELRPANRNKLLMRKCRAEKPHPCDPKRPCDVCNDDEACPRPSVCVEKLKNPYLSYETKCKPGEFLPAAVCREEVPHPCDPPPPCKPGKPKGKPCKPALCKERIKNLEPNYIRCPDPDDIYSYDICDNLQELKTPTPECSSADPCAPPPLKDPFEEQTLYQDKYVPKPEDPNEYLYSRELCKNLEMLKKKIISCFTPHPCDQPVQKDPFEEEPPNYPEKEDPCYLDPVEERKKRRGK